MTHWIYRKKLRFEIFGGGFTATLTPTVPSQSDRSMISWLPDYVDPPKSTRTTLSRRLSTLVTKISRIPAAITFR